MTQEKRQAEPIKGILENLLIHLKKTAKNPNNRIREDWPQLIGNEFATHTQPYAIKNKRLFVKVDDSNLAFELTSRYKTQLLQKVRQKYGSEIITDISFRVGDLR